MEDLTVPLTMEEKVARGKEMAILLIEIHDLEEEIKDFRAMRKERIEEREGRLGLLVTEIKSGESHQEVSVAVEVDLDAALVTYVRSDTGEVIRERAATSSELQMQLPEDEEDSDADFEAEAVRTEAGDSA